MTDPFPLRLRARYGALLRPWGIQLICTSLHSTLGGSGVILDGLFTSSTLLELQATIYQRVLIPPTDQKSFVPLFYFRGPKSLVFSRPSPLSRWTRLGCRFLLVLFTVFSCFCAKLSLVIRFRKSRWRVCYAADVCSSVLYGFPPKELNIQNPTITLTATALTKNETLNVSARSGSAPKQLSSFDPASAVQFTPTSAAAFAARKTAEAASHSKKRKAPTPSSDGPQIKSLSDLKQRLLPGHRINEDGDEEIVVAKRRKSKAEQLYPDTPSLKLLGFVVNVLPDGWIMVDSWVEPALVCHYNFFSVGPISGRFPIYQATRFASMQLSVYLSLFVVPSNLIPFLLSLLPCCR